MHTALCNDLLGKSELLMMAEIIASQRASPLITTNNHEPYEPHGHYEPHKPHGPHGPYGPHEPQDAQGLWTMWIRKNYSPHKAHGLVLCFN